MAFGRGMRAYCYAISSLIACGPVRAQTLPGVMPSVALTHVNIVDVIEGRLLPDMAIVVRGDRIIDVEKNSGFRAPRNARLTRVIDARGKFVIPGLSDMHTPRSYATETRLPLLLAN